MKDKPDFDNWYSPDLENYAWAGWQYVCCRENNVLSIWWSLGEHGSGTNDFAIAQDNLGAWWAVLFKYDDSEVAPTIGPFDSPQAVYATLRLLS